MKLLYNPASPFARKCLVVALEVGADVEAVTVMAKPHQVNEELTAVNPLGKIPTLVTNSGEGIYDSRAICSWLAHEFDAWALYGKTHADHLASEQQQALCDGICDAAVALQYEKVARPEALRWDDFMARQRTRILAAVGQLEADQKLYRSDKIGGIAAICALDYLDFRHGDLDWRGAFPKLVQWYEQNADRPNLRQTKPS